MTTNAQAVTRPTTSSEVSAARSEAPDGVENPCANVLGVEVEALDMEMAISRVAEVLQSGNRGYVCAVGVHGVMEAQRDPEVALAYADAAITIPDGMPMVWVGRIQGHTRMQRVTGPDLMLEVFRRQQFAYCRHFLYGGDDGVADRLASILRDRFPWAKIVGTYTPPFRELTHKEEAELIRTIQATSAHIVWIGISAPKQEKLMLRLLPRLNVKLMFGVGAAFNFHTGALRDCPLWVKQAGLQWLHRLIQEPRRLWKRYLRNNPAFLWCIALQLTRLRRYPPTRQSRRALAPTSK